MRPPLIAAAGVAALALVSGAVGCGGDGGGTPKPPPGVSQRAFARELALAQRPTREDFPRPEGRTLRQLADTMSAGNQAGLATALFVPGTNRLAFGVLDARNAFVYGRTAAYVAASPDRRARGPYLAPADSLITAGRYRSRQAATEASPIAAIYETHVRLSRPGAYSVLVATKTPRGLVGAPTQITVKATARVPAVGQRPPRVSTDTLAGAGSEQAVDTRLPPAPELHRTNFADVLGRRPVALLFATPQLCQSRVCGPVVDIALQLRQKYGERMAFIHQEVYVDNDVNKGLRRPLKAFGLRSEPWLFTVDRHGRVAARLEGSFGLRASEAAITAALR